MKLTDLKTIDIHGKEWFDKTFGNSYFSARYTLNFGMPDEETHAIEWQYGYEQAYVYSVLQKLSKEFNTNLSSTLKVKDKGIILRYHIEETTKNNTIEWGKL